MVSVVSVVLTLSASAITCDISLPAIYVLFFETVFDIQPFKLLHSRINFVNELFFFKDAIIILAPPGIPRLPA